MRITNDQAITYKLQHNLRLVDGFEADLYCAVYIQKKVWGGDGDGVETERVGMERMM